MKVTKLLRFESNDKLFKGINYGIYNHNKVGNLLCKGYVEDTNHPTPYKDYKLSGVWGDLQDKRLYADYVFSFRGLHQLLNWFYSEELIKLIESSKGIDLWEYSCDDSKVFTGNTQCIFHKDSVINKVKINKQSLRLGELIYE